MAQINEFDKVEIKYHRPKFHRRILANLLDAIFFILSFIGLFIGARQIVVSTDSYQAKQSQIQEIKLDSGIFKKGVGGEIRDIITLLNKDDSKSARNKKNDARAAIDSFLTYCGEVLESNKLSEIISSYKEFRLNSFYGGEACFIEEDGNIKETSVAGDSYYYKSIYAQYIDKYCQGYLIKYVPHYYDLNKYMSNILIFGEILPAYCLSGILIYLLPTFIFRRGRKTFGKAIYHIGVVDSRILNCSLPRSLARFSIFYFGELILSLFSFGLPFIVSFSIMVFSKKKQGFSDYMLALEEVDTSEMKIFNDLVEIKLNEITPHKKAVDFTLPSRR